MIKRASSAIIFLITLIICVGIAELACRFIFKDITTTADNSNYFAERWRKRESIELNNLGFREDNIENASTENTFTIAIIGDSFTYGQGIAEQQRFSNIIETQLSKEITNLQVLNFGKPGAETIDHIDILNNHVLPIHPDYILLQWFVNDVEGHDKSLRPQYSNLIPAKFKRLRKKLRKKSALYFFINKAWVQIQQATGMVGTDYESYLIKRFQDPDSQASLDAKNAMHDFIDTVKKQSIPLGIILFPYITDALNKNYPLGFLSDRIMAQCEIELVDCLNLRDTYMGIEPASILWVNQLDQHPGAYANELAADTIISHYKERWLSSKTEYK